MNVRRNFTVRRFPPHAATPVTDDIWNLARNRTEHLGAFAMDRPIHDLLASAWMQGVTDTGQVIDRLARPIDPSIGLVP